MTEIGKSIERAVELLLAEETVAIPTETVYGLAGLAESKVAAGRIFEAKNRPFFDPLITHFHSFRAIEEFVEGIMPEHRLLAEAFMPGPLTLLVKKPDIIPDLVTAGTDMLAVRVPAHPITAELLKKLGRPLAAPSANPFGYISPTRPQHVLAQLGGKIPYILDGGPSKVGIESTIVSVEDGVCIIYRYGGLDIEDIRKVLPNHTFITAKHAAKTLPGTLAKHYSPNRPLVLAPSRIGLEEMGPKHPEALIIVFKTPIPNFDLTRQRVLSSEGSLAEAASNLFATLHEADAMEGVELIIAEPAPGEGIGLAINDRLQRAAAKGKE